MGAGRLDGSARPLHPRRAARRRAPPAAKRAARSVIFPRYHQWDAVLKLEADAKASGPGKSYLVQHSAGSGKSNTIAWLAHRLSNLHDAADKKVFDKVVVITDRVVLDRQLQETIYQFEHARGVVVKIDKDSQQLAEALAGEQARIIITTLQKFPFVLDKIGALPERSLRRHRGRGALLPDRRGGQGPATGSWAATEEQELTVAEAEDAGFIAEAIDPVEEALAKAVAARGRQPNLSFFAFTATPKARTLGAVRHASRTTGRFDPFHLYSMRQAIEEGFILDVLGNYTTYQTYWRIEKAVAEDPAVRERQGPARHRPVRVPAPVQPGPEGRDHRRALPRSTPPAKIGGAGQGDGGHLVPAARRPLQAGDRLLHPPTDGLHRRGGAGGVLGQGDRRRRAHLHRARHERLPRSRRRRSSFAERRLPGADRGREVPDRLRPAAAAHDVRGQGADRPQRRADPVAAQPHPSAQGRTRSSSTSATTREDIVKAFEPYYGRTVAPPTDPNLLYDTRRRLDDYDVLRPDEIEATVAVLLTIADAKDHGRVYASSTPPSSGSTQLDEEDRLGFKDALDKFVRTYSFLSQVVSFGDTKLERDYLYCRALASLLRPEHQYERLDLGSEVELTHLRSEVTFEGSLSLDAETGEVKSIFGDGRGKQNEPDLEPLSQIVDDAQRAVRPQPQRAGPAPLRPVRGDLAVRPRGQPTRPGTTPSTTSGSSSTATFLKTVVSRMDDNDAIFKRILDDEEFREVLMDLYAARVYRRARDER